MQPVQVLGVPEQVAHVVEHVSQVLVPEFANVPDGHTLLHLSVVGLVTM